MTDLSFHRKPVTDAGRFLFCSRRLYRPTTENVHGSWTIYGLVIDTLLTSTEGVDGKTTEEDLRVAVVSRYPSGLVRT